MFATADVLRLHSHLTAFVFIFNPVTTLRPTDGVDVYFEKPVDDTEHANFLRAKTDLEERRMKSINEVTFKEPQCRRHLRRQSPTSDLHRHTLCS